MRKARLKAIKESKKPKPKKEIEPLKFEVKEVNT